MVAVAYNPAMRKNRSPDISANGLTDLEMEVLRSHRQWNQWIEEYIQGPMLELCSCALRQPLINILEQFEGSDGTLSYTYAGGMLVLTRDDDQLLIAHLKEILHHNIKSVHVVSPTGRVSLGGHKVLVKLTHLALEEQVQTLPVGFSDPGKCERIVKGFFKKIPGEVVENIVDRFSRWYLDKSDDATIAREVEMFHRAQEDINVKVVCLPNSAGSSPKELKIVMACRQAPRTGFLLNVAMVIQREGFSLKEISTVYVPENTEDNSFLEHLVLRDKLNRKKRETSINRLLESLSMVQWVEFENKFNREYIFTHRFPIHHTLLLRSMEEFIYQMQVHVDENRFSLDKVHEAFLRYPDVSRAIVVYFSHRFNPVRCKLGREETYRQHVLEMIAGIDSRIADNDERRKIILGLAVEFVEAIQKTNYYVLRRSALSFRLDPAVLDRVALPGGREQHFPVRPFGILYVKGKNFFAFNISFRELARGGVRTIFPFDEEQRVQAHKEVFKECYNLALTQQYKNKDIPEGGAKSVIFVKPYGGMNRELSMELSQSGASRSTLAGLVKEKRAALLRRQLFDAQRSYCDVILDLLIWDPQKKALLHENIVDRYGVEEFVFLGPDENMTDEMIEWISSRARTRGYRIGSSFMSGKKDSGINHKAYGVTSLGVHVYVQEVMKAIGVKVDHGFSVKLSGGPDGDVAGNEIRNLIKSYGPKVQIRAITDGTATAYDPQGLDSSDLMRLVSEEKGMAFFNPDKLHKGGFILMIHERKESRPGSEVISRVVCNKDHATKTEWISAGRANQIYAGFLHGLETDIFIPCGGRPRTLNIENWSSFMLGNGQPSARAIVEGANLYLSDEAREKLASKGVLIVKDASANKCGVICSSYEVQAGLLLGNADWGQLKETFVGQVMKILEARARDEAKLLIDEWAKGADLLQVSSRISRRINEFQDLVMQGFSELEKTPGLKKYFDRVWLEYLPPILRAQAGKNFKTLPELYRRSVIACSIAARLIYKKGLDYQPSPLGALSAELKKGI